MAKLKERKEFVGLRVPISKRIFVSCFCGFQYKLDGEKGHKLSCVFESLTLK